MFAGQTKVQAWVQDMVVSVSISSSDGPAIWACISSSNVKRKKQLMMPVMQKWKILWYQYLKYFFLQQGTGRNHPLNADPRFGLNSQLQFQPRRDFCIPAKTRWELGCSLNQPAFRQIQPLKFPYWDSTPADSVTKDERWLFAYCQYG